MKITPSLAGRYRPRVSATYILLSPQVGVSHDIEVQVRSRALKATPLVGVRVLAKNLTDTASVSHTVPISTLGKVLTDAVTTSDSLTFSVSAVRSDTMVGGDTFTSVGSGILSLTSNGATADSGIIFTQGYTDTLDYFAQDYVGTSRSF